MDTSLKPEEVTGLLNRWRLGDQRSVEKLLPHIYQELRQVARAYMTNERPWHTLQVTGLVHETFMRLQQQAPPNWNDRRHFFGIAARLMRQILVDYARQHQAAKRGAGLVTPLTDGMDRLPSPTNTDYLMLDLVLSKLEELDARRAQIVELRFFGGLTLEETAEAMDLSVSTVKNELTLAKLWMYRELKSRGGSVDIDDHGAQSPAEA